MYSDWWQWEKRTGRENSGPACRHYEFYKQDFDLAKGLNHNAHRLSIEWSRIEPQEGRFSEKELQHYVDVIGALRQRNIEPVVTLHHFTNPLWFSACGGWENRRAIGLFARYCGFVTRALGRQVHFWMTINEPTVYLSHAYILGLWPPQVKSCLKAKAVHDHLIWAHIHAYRLIHKIYKELDLPQPCIGLAQHVQAFVPCRLNLKDRFAAYLRDKIYNFGFLDKVLRYKAMDFIGINYYSRQLVEVRRWGIHNLAADTCNNNHDPVRKNSLGWYIYPKGLYDLLLKLHNYRLPLLISENGICTPDDRQRWEFLYPHLKNIQMAVEKGVDVVGYLYWSLMDNFEWDKGFGPRFGLIDINYNTYQRTVRDSAIKFGQVCKTGILE